MTSYFLTLLIAHHLVNLESHHKVVVLGDFGFGEVHVNLHALVEEFWGLGGVAEEQLAHDAVCSEFVQVTAAEVSEFVVLDRLHVVDSFLVLHVHRLQAGLDGFVFRANVHGFEFFEHLAVGTGGDVREGCNRLQLRRAFVNRGDACVAVEALASVFEHVAGTLRQEHEGLREPRRSRSRKALQLCEEPPRGIARKLQAGISRKYHPEWRVARLEVEGSKEITPALASRGFLI